MGVNALDHPTVRQAIGSLVQRGVKVVTLASDIHHSPRAGYVGIDNRSAGRLAGYLVGRLLGPGRRKVALLAGWLAYRGHEEREAGFRHILAESFPDLETVELAEVQDSAEQAYAATMMLLKKHKDIGAIYNIGAGNSGIARALDETGRGSSVVFVGHDLTDNTKMYLLSGTMDAVIDQNPRVAAREAVQQMVRLVRGDSWNMHPIRIGVVFKENIPED